MNWKQKFLENQDTAHHRKVDRKEVRILKENETATCSIIECKKSIQVGEKYFFYITKPIGSNYIGTIGHTVCITCDIKNSKNQI